VDQVAEVDKEALVGLVLVVELAELAAVEIWEIMVAQVVT
jgi:hypothetical protein